MSSAVAAPAAFPDRPVRGRLELGITMWAGRSVASHQFHEGALRVLRPHYLDGSGQVCYVVVNPGGAYLGADLFVIDVEVGDGAELLLTTQSATKIYRTPRSWAEQRMTIRLGEGARLELVPDQLIAYREARYRQVSHASLHPSSSLVMAEVITPGWSPDGASFAFRELGLRNQIHVETEGGSRLLVLDNLVIRPPLDDVTGVGFMEGFSHVGSLVVVDPRVDQALTDELDRITRDYGAHSGVSLTQSVGGTCGLVLRSLSNSTGELNGLLDACIGFLRGRWYGQEPLNLRKY
ncbi:MULTISPECIES: urease accessory protein UreD [Paenarthrobacter]|uniref:Urease accessory protein UreD n=1 Tax=Paenarthrobacter ureafaciens TaxID=37931 RepID=A0AAX3EJP3_PAEUR|nr:MULTISPECIES: urease accessory protein UreD [Paenarthrobacter]NKR12559.1 urease accessory protein UreD [Arthrobacter sp. M5]NKR15875.1 urease accessory protein UreD [Arthrobacter sp. M6]OEH59855.1 urease accessory protein UreD [Arthrobacter sp. D4]OEH59999.1 urease accessory protein UreD [Arthrobacter sp. D2]MDO5873902.1 urease accessory protein UreD [Paenarthrobacter sp. SD-1]